MTTPSVTNLLEQLAECTSRIDEVSEEFAGELPAMVTLPNGITVEATTADRVLRCGTLCRGLNPRTGEPSYYRFRCGKPHLCLRCAHERMTAERDRIRAATKGGKVFVAVVSETEAKAMVRQLRNGCGADCYRRYPLPSGDIALVHTDPTGPGVQQSIETIDWDLFTSTPDGKNISGKLKAAPPQDTQDTQEPAAIVSVQHVSASKPDGMSWLRYEELVTEAWELAVLKTAHLSPDLETLQLCTRERMKNFILQLDSVGLDVRFSVYRQIKVRESEVDWEPYNERIKAKRRNMGGMVFQTMEQASWYLQQRQFLN